MGILPDVAASLGVSVGAAGQLVTAFALDIALGGRHSLRRQHVMTARTSYAVLASSSWATSPSRSCRAMKARAIATVFGGITLATVLGSPAGIWIGQFMGWQEPFFLIVGLALAAMAAMKLVMRSTPSEQSGGLRVLGLLDAGRCSGAVGNDSRQLCFGSPPTPRSHRS